MEYFTIQVRSRGEERYIRLFNAKAPEIGAKLVFPLRRLSIKRAGKTKDELVPVFPGYIFIEAESRLNPILYWQLRRTEGFFRFLKSNQDVQALEGRDLETVLHFIGIGKVAEKSKVYFDDAERIVVAEGPLKGLEGKIIKVDKRKGRAKVKLDLYDDSFAIDLAFEVIAHV
ncbi:transcription termination/antitermination protein NusG [Treponema sp.]